MRKEERVALKLMDVEPRCLNCKYGKLHTTSGQIYCGAFITPKNVGIDCPDFIIDPDRLRR